MKEGTIEDRCDIQIGYELKDLREVEQERDELESAYHRYLECLQEIAMYKGHIEVYRIVKEHIV